MKSSELLMAITDRVPIKSMLYVQRYLKLIDHYVLLKLKKAGSPGKFEKHHILPVSIFPEYRNAKWNIVVLPTRAHYIAHYMLFKGVKHKSCAYAFNQMRRVSKLNGKDTCRLYGAVRKEFALLVSENNKNVPRSDKQKEMQSIKMKNTNTYRNLKTGELRRFTCNAAPNGWEPFQNGRVRTVESKLKMSESMKGRFWQFNANTKEVKFDFVLHDGFEMGYPDWYIGDYSYLKELTWIYNMETGTAARVNASLGIPDGYAIGRLYDNKGFDKINNSNMIRVVDLKERKFCLINKADLHSPRYTKHGAALDKIFLFMYNNIVYSTFMDLINANPELPKFNKRNLELAECIIPKAHHNMTSERNKFCLENHGKTMADIGLKVIALLDFNYKEGIMYDRH